MHKIKINIGNWLKEKYHRVINSIAFYPAIIALLFLILSALSIAFDFSEEGKEIKLKLQWLRLKDPSTARSIIASIAAGIISLTVFSFSMVMIVLTQTASQMSNRILDKLIGSRFQQVVLGVYVGTIVYALILLSTIRNVDSGIQIPALSTYLLIALTVCDIFLFIYFLHYITQSVKYDVIIKRISDETFRAMKSSCSLIDESDEKHSIISKSVILTGKSGVFEGFNSNTVLALCEAHQCTISFLHLPGTFLLKGVPIANLDRDLSSSVKDQFQDGLHIHQSESIAADFLYGFRQLTEVAIKALSPGINDPGTAIQAVRTLFELYSYLVRHAINAHIRDRRNVIRIIRIELTFEAIVQMTLLPIWDYGKNDRMIRHEFHRMLTQIMLISPKPEVAKLLKEVNLASNMGD